MKTQFSTKPLKLPSRSALNKLGKTDRSISDYGKATPINATDTLSPIVQMMRLRKDR
jgi:hypothetical protein